MQIGVVLKHGQTVPYAVSDSSIIGQVQTSPDFFHGHARLCVLQIVAQVSSPLFFARQPEPSFPRLCHRANSFRNIVITHDPHIAEMAERRFTIIDGVLSEVTVR